MQTLEAPVDFAKHADTLAGSRPTGRARWLDAAIVAMLFILAIVVRWPYLWLVPRFTDETLEVLHSLAIVRDGARPLTNYDAYYGALYNYLVAAGLWLSGESPLAPRAVVLVAGALTVPAIYLLGRSLAGRLLAGPFSQRAAALLGALMLASNGPHVVVNSHVAWANCLTPLFVSLAVWALLRSWLALTGLLLGLALQTHPLVVALLPGAAAYVVGWRRQLFRGPGPYLGVALFLVGYGNMVAYNLDAGFDSLTSAARIRAEYARDEQAASGYSATLASMGLLLARVLGGAVDQRSSVAAYLADPLVVVGCALAGAGCVLLARKGEPLPLLLSLSFFAILPAVNPKFQTLITSRYVMPIVPLLLAVSATALVATFAWVGRRVGVLEVGHRWPRPALAVALVVALCLVVGPLIPLGRYYGRAFERSDTNERILRLTAQIVAARAPDERVLVDDSIGSELPDTGVTELRGLEHLLIFEKIPYRTIRVSTGRLQEELRAASSVLAILNARDSAQAAERLNVTPLDPRPAVQTGRMFDFRLYRLSRHGA